jgi:hypothetical protein
MAPTSPNIAWENVAPAAMLQASIESFQGDVAKLSALIHDNLNRFGAP